MLRSRRRKFSFIYKITNLYSYIKIISLCTLCLKFGLFIGWFIVRFCLRIRQWVCLVKDISIKVLHVIGNICCEGGLQRDRSQPTRVVYVVRERENDGLWSVHRQRRFIPDRMFLHGRRNPNWIRCRLRRRSCIGSDA